LSVDGIPLALSFGDSILWALCEGGQVVRWAVAVDSATTFTLPTTELYHGVCRLGEALVVLASDTLSGLADSSWLSVVDTGVTSFGFEGLYVWGPVAVDMNGDGVTEIVTFSPDGNGIMISVNR
jgi:hypothetical protein